MIFDSLPYKAHDFKTYQLDFVPFINISDNLVFNSKSSFPRHSHSRKTGSHSEIELIQISLKSDNSKTKECIDNGDEMNWKRISLKMPLTIFEEIIWNSTNCLLLELTKLWVSNSTDFPLSILLITCNQSDYFTFEVKNIRTANLNFDRYFEIKTGKPRN